MTKHHHDRDVIVEQRHILNCYRYIKLQMWIDTIPTQTLQPHKDGLHISTSVYLHYQITIVTSGIAYA